MDARFICALSLFILLSCLLAVPFKLVEGGDPDGYPVHNIDTSLNYTTIQAAIDAPETNHGHTIFVEDGTYREHICVYKSIFLVGEDKDATVIDGNGTGNVVFIESSGTIIRNFTIQNGTNGIYINARFEGSYASGTISNNRISNNDENGILVGGDSSGDIIHNNLVVSNNLSGIAVYGGGNYIIGNDIKCNGIGLYITYFAQNTIKYNSIYNNTHNLSINPFPFASDIHTLEMDASNTINGKPVHFIVGQSNLILDTPNMGYLALVDSTNITVKGLTLEHNSQGILLAYSKNCIIMNTNLTNNYMGICAIMCEHNVILNSLISNNSFGLLMLYCFENTFSGNKVFGNQGLGIFMWNSHDNTLYQNFLNNTQQVSLEGSFGNGWDNGSEGNYWSDYNGTDDNGDGIGDTPYIIDWINQDNHPLMGMLLDFQVSPECHVQAICNSSISDFQFNGTAISFNVTGQNNTIGFCRIRIPTALMNEPFKVFVNNTEVTYIVLPCSNSTYSYLYFTYSHSTQAVIIIPESPTFLILPLLMVATLLAVTFRRRKHSMKSLKEAEKYKQKVSYTK